MCLMYHALGSGGGSIDRGALGGVAVAEAVAADDHVVEGVVVLLRHLVARVEQVVAQRVELDELHPEVGDLQHVCTHTQEVRVLYKYTTHLFLLLYLSRESRSEAS